MKRYIPTITSTHNGKLLVVNEPFTADQMGFKDIDIHCLLNNGRIRIDNTFIEPVIEKKEVKEEKIQIKFDTKEDLENIEENLDNMSDDELLKAYEELNEDIEMSRKIKEIEHEEREEKLKEEQERKELKPKKISYIKKINEKKNRLNNKD